MFLKYGYIQKSSSVRPESKKVRHKTVAVFLVPDWGMKKPAMASGLRTGWPAYVLGGPVQKPDAIAGFIPQSRTKNWASG